MTKHSNTYPYTNANRAGRTQPGLVEIIEKDDPRHFANPRHNEVVANRADRRARGYRLPVGTGTRRNPISRYQRRHGSKAGA